LTTSNEGLDKKQPVFIQILAPNADACGQHPDQTGDASLIRTGTGPSDKKLPCGGLSVLKNPAGVFS